MICEVIQQVLKTGYLRAETEIKIQLMFNGGCSLDELDALIDLQEAILSGRVKREFCLPQNISNIRANY